MKKTISITIAGRVFEVDEFMRHTITLLFDGERYIVTAHAEPLPDDDGWVCPIGGMDDEASADTREDGEALFCHFCDAALLSFQSVFQSDPGFFKGHLEVKSYPLSTGMTMH